MAPFVLVSRTRVPKKAFLELPNATQSKSDNTSEREELVSGLKDGVERQDQVRVREYFCL